MKKLTNLFELFFALVFSVSLSAGNPPLFLQEKENTEEESVETKEVYSRIYKLSKANGLIKFYLSDREIWAVDISSAVRKYARITNDPQVKLIKSVKTGEFYLLRNIPC